MSHALEGPPKRGPTLTEQANSQRLCRSMFIGHTAGYLLIGALIVAGFIFYGLTQQSGSQILELRIPPYVLLALAVVGFVVLADLMVRRRHDRGHSGIDAVVWLIVALGSSIAHLFANAHDILFWIDCALGLGGLYLFVVLVLLPGDPTQNPYGPRPRPS